MQTDFEIGEVLGRFYGDIEKTVRHLLVRTPLLTQLRIAETHNIKAETASLSGIANKGITLRICSPQRVRSAQHTPTGRERAFPPAQMGFG